MSETTTTVTDEQIKQYVAEQDAKYPEFAGSFAPKDDRDRAQIESEIRQDQLAATLTLPACPSWCAYAEGHEYDSLENDGETFSRIHSTSGEAEISISLRELNRTNVLTYTAPVIDLWVAGDHGGEVDSDKARALASELVAAAFKLEEIKASAK